MSRKKGRKGKSSKVHTAEKGKVKEVIIICLGVAIAAIPFCYGKYFEFQINGPFDGAMNIYSAKCIVEGQKLDTEVSASARPATLLVNVIGVAIFGYSEFGPKLIQMLMQLAALGLMFYTLRKIYGALPAAVSLILAAFYLSCPPYAKYGNVKEQFMIACMIISACCVILNHCRLGWWLLIMAGFFGINIYYFKPTGISVIIAIIVYLLTCPASGRRTLPQVVSDLCCFVFGTVLGLLPLVIFYTWQGQIGKFLTKFPAPVVVLAAIVAGVGFLIRFIHSRTASLGISSRRAGILWLLAGAGAIVVLTVCFREKASSIFEQITKLLNLSSGYLEGSRLATTFRSQYDNVMGYYSGFVMPIGFSLLAIFWWAGESAKGLFHKSNKTADQNKESVRKESFVLMLGLWWILDMFFVWISPRSYVEYYLPLNASAAMLAGFTVYKCQQKPAGLLWLLGSWLLVDIMLRWIVPTETIPYLGIQPAEVMPGYWGRLSPGIITFAIAIVIYWVGKSKGFLRGAAVIIGLICFGMFFRWNTGNLQWFDKRIQECKRGAGEWEQLAWYIRENSSPDEAIYVWGWVPGIYVQSQRFSPGSLSSYGNMHTDTPGRVKGTIKRLLAELKANPPRYIVDTQKIHFPYYEHPNFDLWPSWEDKKKTKFHFRIIPSHRPVGMKRFLLADMEKNEALYNKGVEESTNFFLRHPQRKGGPVEEQRARKMARTERKRHEAMAPLRKFVMENYRPVNINLRTHVLFERK